MTNCYNCGKSASQKHTDGNYYCPECIEKLKGIRRMFTASADDLTRIINASERAHDERDDLRDRTKRALKNSRDVYMALAMEGAENPDSPLNDILVAVLQTINTLEAPWPNHN